MSRKKVVYFTNIAPHYRDPLWQLLVSDCDFEFHFFFGKPSLNGIKEINFSSLFWQSYQSRIHYVANCRLKGILIWQRGVVKEVLFSSSDDYIFVGDMFIISTWIASIIARVKKKNVYYWGHGIYGDETCLKLFFRSIFLSLANRHLVYNNHARNLMIKTGLKKSKLYVIYNSLNYDKHLQLRNETIENDFYKTSSFFANADLPVLIFIGRLTPQKKLDMLIEAVKGLNSRTESVNLLIVGTGPMMTALIEQSKEIKSYVYFYGPCYDEEMNCRLLFNASICISPGSIGLTAIHSLSFGTPVISHSNFLTQGPEFEVIEENVTGAFFEENNIESLIKVVRDWLLNHPIKDSNLRNVCYEKIDKYYNPHYQLQILKLAIASSHDSL